ncbi:type III-B CRISPR module RAMP protein Cmr1, partial [Schnuerera sp.]|uniref:type III-B CRISPR module RAMP protein Cmr1 n=1 Tax=Schnuerera sp. TaxID=2794844 RepID=UPI002C7E4010
MEKEKLTIKLKTLTPIWTGDAFGESNKIKSQSIYGGLRYWFELYCKSVGIVVKDFENEELDKKMYIKEMDDIINSQNNFGIDEVKKIIMNNCGITLTSQIFGCKGLKGDLEIIDINSNKKIINKNNIDFRFLNMNIKFWMNKIFFNNAENLECHLDLVLKVKLSHHYIREFKRFLKYYEDKIILIG